MPTMKEVLDKQHTWDSGTCEADMRPIYDALVEVVREMLHTNHDNFGGVPEPEHCDRCRLEAILGGEAKKST